MGRLSSPAFLDLYALPHDHTHLDHKNRTATHSIMAIRPVNLPVLPLEEPAKQLAAFLTNEAQTSFGCNAIPSDWMQKWIHFAEQDTMKIPPMINTTSLIGKVPTGIVAPGQLASFLTVDYVFIEERIWSYLTARYVLSPINGSHLLKGHSPAPPSNPLELWLLVMDCKDPHSTASMPPWTAAFK